MELGWQWDICFRWDTECTTPLPAGCTPDCRTQPCWSGRCSCSLPDTARRTQRRRC